MHHCPTRVLVETGGYYFPGPTTFNTPHTPSVSRPTFVAIQFQSENIAPIIECKIYVGGVEITRAAIVGLTSKGEGGAIVFPFSFYVPPGQAWQVNTIGGFTNLTSSYVLL